ncbi:PXMP2/4 family protein 4-like isoform X2 [Planococcus citri]
MVSYGTIWPSGCFLQQIIAGDEEFDFRRAARFSVFGCFYVAPTINVWLRLANKLWPKNDFKSAVTKAVVEQVSYTPFAMVSFYTGMSLLEGKTLEGAKEEVQAKFLPTYKVGALAWPVLQTINHMYVPERNKIPFVSVCSLMWSSFLAYMNRKEKPTIN